MPLEKRLNSTPINEPKVNIGEDSKRKHLSPLAQYVDLRNLFDEVDIEFQPQHGDQEDYDSRREFKHDEGEPNRMKPNLCESSKFSIGEDDYSDSQLQIQEDLK